MNLTIRGAGVLGGFGCGLEDLRIALMDQECRARNIPINTPQGPLEVPTFLAETSQLDRYVSKKALRRVDHYSKMALLGAYLALEDAGQLEADRQSMGIVIATGYGASRTTFTFLDSYLFDGDQLSSPIHFSNSVHNAAGATISMLLGITGPALTVSQFEMSVPSALLTAGIWLEEGRVDSVLFGAVDEYCDLLGYCRYRYFGDPGRDGKGMNPLSFDLQTALAGEGAAFFLLNRAEEGNESSYGFIRGVEMGRYLQGPLAVSEETLLFIGADGHKICGSNYNRYLPKKNAIACYTPLYGSFPSSPAFDLAIGALSIKNKKVFPSPHPLGENPELQIIHKEADFRWEKICCLKIGGEGEWGAITLSPFLAPTA
jgi:3-oxoacyl-[acyl-carrier-protein] synthase II